MPDVQICFARERAMMSAMIEVEAVTHDLKVLWEEISQDLKAAIEEALTNIDDSASVRIGYEVGLTEDKDVYLMISLGECNEKNS